MMTLFAPSAKDQSLIYLYNIFGSMNGVIPAPGGGATPTTMLTLLGTMFKTFNSVILAVGALIVVYVTIVGVMNTAHEGQFMGKNWNNLWLPIRTVLGIAALVPTGSGYSGLQIVMMWVILQGIGAADTLWGTALSFVNEMGSPFAQVTIPTSQASLSLDGLFHGIMCAKSAATRLPKASIPEKERVKQKEKDDAGLKNTDQDGAYYCAVNPGDDGCRSINSSSFAPDFNDPKETVYKPWPNGGCGALAYCSQEMSCAVLPDVKDSGPDSLKCLSCKAQITALKAIIPTFASIAENYIKIDSTYMYYYYAARAAAVNPKLPKPAIPEFVQNYCTAKGKPCTAANLMSPRGEFMNASNDVTENIYWPFGLKPLLGDKSFMNTAILFYTDGVGDAVNKYMLALATDTSVALKGPLEKARNDGWILAGSYYHILARMNNTNMRSSVPDLTFEFKTEDMPEVDGSRMYGYRNNFTSASRLICLAAGSSCGNESSKASQVISGGAADSDKMFKTMISNEGNTDPLAQLTATGYALMFLASILMIAFIVVVIIMAVLSGINIMVLGSGLPISPAFPVTLELLMLFLPLFFLFVGFLISIGGTLGIYVPLIPYIIFTMGAIGWMISTIEAMVAGPLVALGILSPSGHHELLGKAEPALGLLFSIFLRPSLMIFGMMAAMLLSSVVVTMVNAGFNTVSNNLFDFGGKGSGQAALAANPVASILVLVAYVNLIVVALNKTFSTIYIIPERVLSWISIQVPQEGAGEALGEMKSGIAGGAAGMSKAGDTGSGMASSNMGSNKGKIEKGQKAQGKMGAGTANPVGPGEKDADGNVGEGPSGPPPKSNH
jgi:hypothetical protein